MKPIHINPDTLTTEQPPKYKKFKVETPVGNLESDSGNHMIDVISIVGVIAILYVGKKLVDKYLR